MIASKTSLSRMAAVLLLVFFLSGLYVKNTDAQSDESASSSAREALLRQIEGLEQEINKNQEEAKSLSKDIDKLTNNIKGQELEIRQINSAIKATTIEIKDTETILSDVRKDIDKNKLALANNLVLLEQSNRNTLLEIFLGNQRLSDFLDSVDQLENIHAQVIDATQILKQKRVLLEEKQDELETKSGEYDRLRSLEVSQKRELESNRTKKNQVLKSTNQQIATSKKNLAEIKNQLFYLEKTGVSAEDAVTFATLAANRVGIRPAFLLALLEVETGKAFRDGTITAGTHLGSGNWKRDLYDCLRNLGKYASAESQKKAFFQITDELNYNPDTMPVSARPSYGCGGAMGPGQFLPSTWLVYKSRVAQITGHTPPDPWKIEDAFTASALYLADAGATAKTSDAERRAAKTYISGSPNCTKSICNIYSSQILSLASAIEKNL